MAQFPAFPLWTDAYLGDTTHLTTIEHGAYLLLLIVMWRSKDGTLPDDEHLLARYTKLRPNHWRKIRPILEPFFVIENGIWTQLRLKDELESVKLLSQSQSRKAKGRWERYSKSNCLKNNDTNNAAASSGHIPDECPADASPTPTPTPKEKDTIVSKKKDGPKTKNYAFEGQVIKLNQSDFESFQKNCPKLSENEYLLALSNADMAYHHGQSDNWFFRLSGYLKKTEPGNVTNGSSITPLGVGG